MFNAYNYNLCHHCTLDLVFTVFTRGLYTSKYGTCRTAIAYSCFVTGRDRVILYKSALKHIFEECLLDYLAKTIVFISWNACGILKYKLIFLLPHEVAFKCSTNRGMILYVASAILAYINPGGGALSIYTGGGVPRHIQKGGSYKL